MASIIVAKKGYTLKVVSWENDGDNYSTLFHTVSSCAEAQALRDVCNILFGCNSDHKNPIGIGNMMGDDDYQSVIKEYLIKHPEVTKYLGDAGDIMDFNYAVMGGSEYYTSRVCDSVEVTYVSEDVYGEIVE